MSRLYFCAMNRHRPFALICALCAPLLLAACGNRGPLVLPDAAPPPPMSAPAEPAAADEDGAAR
jgi:predicted small lipoprotein YifL